MTSHSDALFAMDVNIASLKTSNNDVYTSLLSSIFKLFEECIADATCVPFVNAL